MIRFLVGLFCLLTCTISNSQIHVPLENNVLIGVFGEGTCADCDHADSLFEKNNLTTLKIHFFPNLSEEYYAPQASEITEGLNLKSGDQLTINGIAASKDLANDHLTLHQSQEDEHYHNSLVNVGFDWKIENDTIFVHSKVEFFTPHKGKYRMALYLVENNLKVNNELKQQVFRAAVNGAFGEVVGQNNVQAGTEKLLNYAFPINQSWNKKELAIVGIIWKEEERQFKFVNGNDKGGKLDNYSDLPTPISKEIKLYPNPVSEFLTISNPNLVNLNLNLYRITGEFIEEYQFNEAENQIDVKHLESGKYYLLIYDQYGNHFTFRFDVKVDH